MKLNDFEQQIQAAQRQLDTLQQCITYSPTCSKEREEEAIAQLSIALEELNVATEELQQQNDQLYAARTEVELERQRYQELFEEVPDGYIVTDAKGIIQEANHAAETLLNLCRDRLVGKPLILFTAQKDYDIFHTKLDRVIQSQHSRQSWETYLKPRGSEAFPVEITVSTQRISKQKLSWLIRDLTLTKQAEATRQELEEEKELSELKTRFIHTVAHEFRTPLSVIQASAQLISFCSCRTHQDEKRKQTNIERIRISVKKLARLLEDVLWFHKTEAEKQRFNPSTLNLEDLCLKLIEQEQRLFGNPHKIQFTTDGKCHSLLLDEKLLEQILGNLLSNALKYSPESSTVDFALSCEDDQVILRIQDHGIGIPAEDQPHLFEPFHRAENIGTLPGTGLGLAIVKKAVELHQGAIAYKSSVGVGTTFTVTLPLLRESHS